AVCRRCPAVLAATRQRPGRLNHPSKAAVLRFCAGPHCHLWKGPSGFGTYITSIVSEPRAAGGVPGIRGGMMDWLQSRRLHYVVGAVALLFALFAALRLMFFFGFSGLDSSALSGVEAVPETLSIGLRFDLRLAILVLLPVAVLAWLPRWNLTRVIVLRWIARVYLAVALA